MLRQKRLVLLKTALPKLQRHFSLIHQRDKYLTRGLQLFNAYCLGTSPRRAPSSSAGGARRGKGAR
jgi:hypothetical protein